MDELTIRAPRAGEHAAIHALVAAAFGRMDEANLVPALHYTGDALFDLVACDGAEVVGHIMFSRMGGDLGGIAALGPVAAAPARQKSGIGSALMRAGIAECRARGVRGIVLLGHPSYYPRFGFSAAAAAKLASPYAGRDAFMALELEPGVFAKGGIVQFAGPFGE